MLRLRESCATIRRQKMPSPPLPPGPEYPRTDLYHGLFLLHSGQNGQPTLSRQEGGPSMIPCPTTGRPLRVATIEAQAVAICPHCGHQGRGGFVSFQGDLRMAYACPGCLELIWLAGA
jgi:hypothetical protein